MKNELINQQYRRFDASSIYHNLCNFKINLWFFEAFKNAFIIGSNNALDTFNQIHSYFHAGIPVYSKFKVYNKENAKLDFSTINLACLTDYYTLKNLPIELDKFEFAGKEIDLLALKSLKIVLDNILENEKFIPKDGFIENYEIMISETPLMLKLSNGKVFYGTSNKDEVKLTVEVMKAIKNVDSVQRINIMEFLKLLKNFKKNYSNSEHNSLANFLMGLQLDKQTSNQLLNDVRCMVVDIIDNSIIRESHEDEESNAYKIYRNRKLNSLLHQHF